MQGDAVDRCVLEIMLVPSVSAVLAIVDKR